MLVGQKPTRHLYPDVRPWFDKLTTNGLAAHHERVGGSPRTDWRLITNGFAFQLKDSASHDAYLTRSWHGFSSLLQSGALDEAQINEDIAALDAIARKTWWVANPEARMQVESVLQRHRREGREEGREEGRVEELRSALLAVIDVRELTLKRGDLQRIERSTSPRQLQRWLVQAAIAEKTLVLDNAR